MTWTYTNPQVPSLAEVLKEINGKTLADAGRSSHQAAIERGSTDSRFHVAEGRRHDFMRKLDYTRGIYGSGQYDRAARYRRSVRARPYPGWDWSWPANRRVLYNRASCDLDGKPWDATRNKCGGTRPSQKWVGNDVPDFKADSKPSEHMGPFIMNPEGVGRIFGPLALVRRWTISGHSTSQSKARSKILCIPNRRTIRL